MLTQSLIELYERDLNKLKEELNLYKDEASIWKVEKGIANSAGNLVLHLVGNINHFIGATLGNTGYVRNRDYEFAGKNVPRADLVDSIDKVIVAMKESLSKLPQEDMGKDFPIQFLPKKQDAEFMLVFFLAHFNYHLGQVNYHRRLID